MQSNLSYEGGKMPVHPPATILVTGANGFVGKALCDTLLQHGHVVRGAVRRVDASLKPAITCFNIGEINSQTDWSSALHGVECVIHLAARVHVMHETSVAPLHEFHLTNVMGTERLARSAAAQGVKRLVYVSSIKVNGEETKGSIRYTEHDLPSPQDPYGVSKWEAEQVLQQVARDTGLEIVIVRPPLVYGAGVKGNFERMLKLLGKGLPLPLASVNNSRSMLYVGNLVDALRVCAVHPVAAGKTFLLSDGEDISTPDLMRQLALGLGKSVLLLPFPVAFLKLAGMLLGKSAEIARLVGSLRIDSGKIRRDLDWQPPYSLKQGLQATSGWYKATKL